MNSLRPSICLLLPAVGQVVLTKVEAAVASFYMHYSLSFVLQKLIRYSQSGSIVVMHDFFIDRIIKLLSTKELFHTLNEKAGVGGGSIREGISATEIKGGNVINQLLIILPACAPCCNIVGETLRYVIVFHETMQFHKLCY